MLKIGLSLSVVWFFTNWSYCASLGYTRCCEPDRLALLAISLHLTSCHVVLCDRNRLFSVDVMVSASSSSRSFVTDR